MLLGLQQLKRGANKYDTVIYLKREIIGQHSQQY